MKILILCMAPLAMWAAEEAAASRLFDSKLSATQRAEACFELRGASGADAIAAMSRAMEDPDLLSCAADNLRIAGAVDALQQALASTTPTVRAAAARQLGSFRRADLLDALNGAAQDENALVATNALAGLSQYDDAAVIPYLAALARKGGMNGDMALDRLALKDSGAALKIARELLASAQVPDQLYAMRVMGGLGNRSDLPALRKIAAHEQESLTQRNRGFGFMPPINLARAAQSAIRAIEGR